MVPNPYLSIQSLLRFIDLLIIQVRVVAFVILLLIWTLLPFFIVPAKAWEVLFLFFIPPRPAVRLLCDRL